MIDTRTLKAQQGEHFHHVCRLFTTWGEVGRSVRAQESDVSIHLKEINGALLALRVLKARAASVRSRLFLRNVRHGTLMAKSIGLVN